MNTVFSPRILQCMRFKTDAKLPSPERTVMDYEFDFCVGCNRRMQLDGKTYNIEKGCFVVRTPGQKVRTIGAYDCYMLTLDFSNRPVKNYSRNKATRMQDIFPSEMWKVIPPVFKPIHYDDYEQIFEELVSINDLDINQNESVPTLVNRLLHLVISDAFSHRHSRLEKKKDELDRVCAYIKKHFCESISLDDLAKLVHLNKSYLIRKFKSEYGVSPVSYLIEVRMSYAKKLLAETNLPIKEIAAKCGYRDSSFFNSYFKKTFSVTPTSYRYTQNNFDLQ